MTRAVLFGSLLFVFASVAGCGSDDGTGSPSSGGGTGAGGSSGTGGSLGGTGGSTGGTAGADSGAGGTAGAAGAAGSGGFDCSKYSSSSPDAACTDFATAFCGLVFACVPLGLATGFDSQATCETRIKLSCVTSFSLPGTGLQVGDVGWLTEMLKTKTCQDVYDGTWTAGDSPQPCGTLGSLADGQPCVLKGQCASDYCPRPAGAACGTCTAKAANGANCSSSSECQSGRCDFSSSTCLARQKVGGSCTFSADCEDGLHCATSGQCAPDQDAGGPCSNFNDDDCKQGLVCNANDTCGPPALGGLGGDCNAAASEDCDVFHSLGCDPVTKKCVDNPQAADGEACGYVSGMTKLCAAGISCIAGTCITNAKDGEACSDANGPVCISPARCVAGTCTLVDGSTCPTN